MERERQVEQVGTEAGGWWTERQTCAACPVQYEGRVGDAWWYFRARYASWEFAVGATVDEAVEVTLGWRDGFLRSGDYDDAEKSGFGAGYMPTREAENIIARCMTEYADTARGAPRLRTT